jgi:hypothetical protein
MELTSAYFIVSIFDSSNLEGQVPVFISPRNRATSYGGDGGGGLLTADGQSTSSSWYRAPLWGP